MWGVHLNEVVDGVLTLSLDRSVSRNNRMSTWLIRFPLNSQLTFHTTNWHTISHPLVSVPLAESICHLWTPDEWMRTATNKAGKERKDSLESYCPTSCENGNDDDNSNGTFSSRRARRHRMCLRCVRQWLETSKARNGTEYPIWPIGRRQPLPLQDVARIMGSSVVSKHKEDSFRDLTHGLARAVDAIWLSLFVATLLLDLSRTLYHSSCPSKVIRWSNSGKPQTNRAWVPRSSQCARYIASLCMLCSSWWGLPQ